MAPCLAGYQWNSSPYTGNRTAKFVDGGAYRKWQLLSNANDNCVSTRQPVIDFEINGFN